MSTRTESIYVPHTDAPPAPLQPVASLGVPRRTHAHAKLDRLGIWLSGACAVHCAVVPIVLILFPVVSWIHWSRIMDIVALSVAAVFGLGGCLLSLRHHRDARPLMLVIGGLMLNATGRFAALSLGPFLAQTLVVGGPLTMAYGLWRDRRLCKCSGHAH
jgi:hypothetical protein